MKEPIYALADLYSLFGKPYPALNPGLVLICDSSKCGLKYAGQEQAPASRNCTADAVEGEINRGDTHEREKRELLSFKRVHINICASMSPTEARVTKVEDNESEAAAENLELPVGRGNWCSNFLPARLAYSSFRIWTICLTSCLTSCFVSYIVS